MAGKPIDYDGMISVYHQLNKQRALTERESERLDDLIRRQTQSKASAAYRAKHREMLLEKKRKWYQENRERALVTMRDYIKRKPHKNKEACRRYRQKLLANPF
jgi:hypothetical protein